MRTSSSPTGGVGAVGAWTQDRNAACAKPLIPLTHRTDPAAVIGRDEILADGAQPGDGPVVRQGMQRAGSYHGVGDVPSLQEMNACLAAIGLSITRCVEADGQPSDWYWELQFDNQSFSGPLCDPQSAWQVWLYRVQDVCQRAEECKVIVTHFRQAGEKEQADMRAWTTHPVPWGSLRCNHPWQAQYQGLVEAVWAARDIHPLPVATGHWVEWGHALRPFLDQCSFRAAVGEALDRESDAMTHAALSACPWGMHSRLHRPRRRL